MRGDVSSIQGKLEVMETKQVTRQFCKKNNSVKKLKVLFLFKIQKRECKPNNDTQEEAHQANMGTHER